MLVPQFRNSQRPAPDPSRVLATFGLLRERRTLPPARLYPIPSHSPPFARMFLQVRALAPLVKLVFGNRTRTWDRAPYQKIEDAAGASVAEFRPKIRGCQPAFAWPSTQLRPFQNGNGPQKTTFRESFVSSTFSQKNVRIT